MNCCYNIHCFWWYCDYILFKECYSFSIFFHRAEWLIGLPQYIPYEAIHLYGYTHVIWNDLIHMLRWLLLKHIITSHVFLINTFLSNFRAVFGNLIWKYSVSGMKHVIPFHGIFLLILIRNMLQIYSVRLLWGVFD